MTARVTGQPVYRNDLPSGDRGLSEKRGKRLWATIVPTRDGYAGVAASAYGVLACTWHHGSEQEAADSLSSILRPLTRGGGYAAPAFLGLGDGLPPHLAAAREGLEAYGAGDYNSLRNLEIDPRARSAFITRVHKVVQGIPSGSVMSYGEVAARAGNKNAARAVGRAMGTNPLAPIVPCHRVVAAGGRIGGFGPGIPAKIRLLRREGVDVDERGLRPPAQPAQAGEGGRQRLF